MINIATEFEITQRMSINNVKYSQLLCEYRLDRCGISESIDLLFAVEVYSYARQM